MAIKISAGHRFGRLIAVEFAGHNHRGKRLWLCNCACGTEKTVLEYNLQSGNSTSCGCANRESIVKHGRSRTKLFNIWQNMLDRCRNTNNKQYADYGGRGIKVCERWHEFANFAADMGSPEKGLSLERLNNAEGYCPENCTWATRHEQQRNLRTNQWVDFRGERLLVTDLAKRLGTYPQLIRNRINRGWDIERAVTTPPATKGK